MLQLEKQQTVVRRVVTLITDHREEARPIDHYVVSLYPNGTIGFRGCRRPEDSEVRVPLASCLSLALAAELQANAPANGNGNHGQGRAHNPGRKPCTTRKRLHRRPATRR